MMSIGGRLGALAFILIAGCAPASDGADPPSDSPAAGDGTIIADDAEPEEEGASVIDSATVDDGKELTFDDPEEIVPDNLAVQSGAPTQIVFLNFGGPIIRSCASCSDATTNRTFIIGQYLKRSQVDFAPYTNAARRTAIATYLRAWFSRYNIRFTTKRPLAGPYSMAVVTPSYAPNHGIAPLDCGNQSRSDIAFVFRTGDSSAHFLAQEIAHELGHSFGLAHVQSSADFMQWASSGSAFTSSTYDTAHRSGKCFTGSVQHAPALLASALGLKP